MTMVFLSGAEMVPERIRADWPGARFLARARLQPRPAGAVPPPVGERFDSWGVLIEAPGSIVEGEIRSTVTDDGRTFSAVVAPPDDADAVAVLAAARYWELPPAYVRRLAQLAAVPVEEYFY